MTLAAANVSVCLGQRTVLQDFAVNLAPGELVAFVGANGAGKSTALKVLAGLLPVACGRVTLNGTDLSALDGRVRGRHLAYVPQQGTVHWGLSVSAVVALGRLPHRDVATATSRDRSAILNAMSRMHITHLADRSICELSGGEQARVLLARALAQEAAYLIADEPVAGLDGAHMLSLFEDLRRIVQGGAAVVTALHDLALAARFATRVLVFLKGRCIADGPADEVLSSHNLAQAFDVDGRMASVEGIPVFLPRRSLLESADMT